MLFLELWVNLRNIYNLCLHTPYTPVKIQNKLAYKPRQHTENRKTKSSDEKRRFMKPVTCRRRHSEEAEKREVQAKLRSSQSSWRLAHSILGLVHLHYKMSLNTISTESESPKFYSHRTYCLYNIKLLCKQKGLCTTAINSVMTQLRLGHFFVPTI